MEMSHRLFLHNTIATCLMQVYDNKQATAFSLMALLFLLATPHKARSQITEDLHAFGYFQTAAFYNNESEGGGTPDHRLSFILQQLNIMLNKEFGSAFSAFTNVEFTNSFSDDMKRVWLRMILSGEGRAPTLLRSAEDLVERVAATPGAVGYVPLALVTRDVKVIATIQ